MTKQEFFQQFVLLAMTNNIHEQYFSPSDALRRASEVWDVIEDNIKPSILVALAEKALLRLESGKYISQERTGEWFVFENEPEINPTGNAWRCGKEKGWSALFDKGAPPADFTKQCYRISDILGTK